MSTQIRRQKKTYPEGIDSSWRATVIFRFQTGRNTFGSV